MDISRTSQLFVFKNNKLFGYIQDKNFYQYKENGEVVISNNELNKMLDLVPEGIDYEIMARSFSLNSNVEMLYYLKNPIGAYSFSDNIDNFRNEHIISDSIECSNLFPNVLNIKINLLNSELYPGNNQNIAYTKSQRFSISGVQHKLQAYIKDNELFSGYGDYILKPDSIDYYDIPINEHLHTTFMREFGIEVPFNALIFDDVNQTYHYLIKRFDIIDEKNKKEQYSVNALMGALPRDKYEGTIENICDYINNANIAYSKDERIKFLKYIFANILLYNSDLHKKNINFFYEDGKFYLTPAYDILNIYAIKANLGDGQVALPIGYKNKKISFNDFSKSIEILELDKNYIFNEFEKIARIYFSKYPLYLEKLYNSSVANYMKNKETFFTKALETYNKNLFIFSKLFSDIELFNESKFALESVKKLARKSDEVKKILDRLVEKESNMSNITQQQKFSIVKELGIDRNETTEISTLNEYNDGGGGSSRSRQR